MKKKSKPLSPDIEDLLADYLGQDATPSKPPRQTSKSDREPANVAATPVREFDPEPSPEPEPELKPDPNPPNEFKLELEPMLRPSPEPEPSHVLDSSPPNEYKLELEPILRPSPEPEPMHVPAPGSSHDSELELDPILRPSPEPEPESKPDLAFENKVPHAPVKELFLLIEKAVKTLNLYEGKGDICEKAIDLAFKHLSDLSSQYGNIYINVTPYEFLLEQQPVYTTQEEQSGITYRLFRDGLRELEFKPCIKRRELADFLDILRSSPSSDEEADSITLLWEKEMPGISYQAADLFFEGALSAESNEFQEQVEKLMTKLKASITHSEMSNTAQNLKAGITPETIKHARSHLSQVMATLPHQGGQAADLTSLESQVPDCSDDISRRTLGITLQLLEIGGGPVISSLFLQNIETILLEGNWDRLVSPCQTAGKFLRKTREGQAEQQTGQSIRAALAELCKADKLLALQSLLVTCSLSQFRQLVELFKILPPDADSQLLRLLSQLPDGEIQEQMLAFLQDRGLDFVDYYTNRLLAPQLQTVTNAITNLQSIGSPQAMTAMRSAANHPNPKVRLALFQALEDQLDDALLPQLLSSLSMNHQQLRQQIIPMLKSFSGRRFSGLLLNQIQQDLFEEMSPTHRRNLLEVLALWGGPEAESFIVQAVTISNTFRRRRVEEKRQEMLAAIKEVNGAQGLNLLTLCLKNKISKATRSSIEEILQTMDRNKR